MKTSNKILLAVGIVPFIIITAMMFSFKGILDEDLTLKKQDTDRSNYTSRTFALEGFKKIKATGIWKIDLKGGDHFKIEVNAPEDLIKKISVTKQEKSLLLSSEKNSFSVYNMPRATITMPSLSGMNLDGQFDIKIKGFEIDKLDIDFKGVLDIAGAEGSIERLFFNGTGVALVSYNKMPVTNAHFNFNGFYWMMMYMDGGELSGLINGFGKLFTIGNLTENSIKVNNSNHAFKVNNPNHINKK